MGFDSPYLAGDFVEGFAVVELRLQFVEVWRQRFPMGLMRRQPAFDPQRGCCSGEVVMKLQLIRGPVKELLLYRWEKGLAPFLVLREEASTQGAS